MRDTIRNGLKVVVPVPRKLSSYPVGNFSNNAPAISATGPLYRWYLTRSTISPIPVAPPALFIHRAVRATKGVQVDGATSRRGSTCQQTVDTLGHLLAVPVTAANEPDRHPVHTLATQVQDVTGDAVEVASVDEA